MGKPDPLRLHQFSAIVKDPASSKSTLGQGTPGGVGASIRTIMRLHAQGQRGDSSARPEGGGEGCFPLEPPG